MRLSHQSISTGCHSPHDAHDLGCTWEGEGGEGGNQHGIDAARMERVGRDLSTLQIPAINMTAPIASSHYVRLNVQGAQPTIPLRHKHLQDELCSLHYVYRLATADLQS